MSEQTEQKKVVKLSQGQLFQLGDWLRGANVRAWLDENGPTFKATAEKATAELGFDVTTEALTRVAKTLEINWKSKPVKVAKLTKDEQIAALKAEVEALKAKLASYEGQSEVKAEPAVAPESQVAPAPASSVPPFLQ